MNTKRASSAPEPAKLSELIGLIYDASLDDGLWGGFLDALARAFHASQAILFHLDNCGTRKELITTVGLDVDIISRWKECKEHVDVWLQHVFDVQEGQTYFSTQLIEQRALRRTGFHCDILRPLDIEHTLGGVPENSPLGRSFLGIYHSGTGGAFTEAQRAAYGMLMPHVQRAFSIQRRMRMCGAAVANARAAVDRSPYGVVVLDALGNVLLFNEKAEVFFRESDGIALRNASLHLQDVAAQQRFERLTGSPGLIDGQLRSGGGIHVLRPSGRQPYHLLVCPMNRSQEQWPLVRHGAYLVFIHDPTEPKDIPPDLLKQIYGLTPAEARLCAALFRHGTLELAMQELGITRNTAKAQLVQVFAKSGVKSQGELLQHVALGLCRPSKI